MKDFLFYVTARTLGLLPLAAAPMFAGGFRIEVLLGVMGFFAGFWSLVYGIKAVVTMHPRLRHLDTPLHQSPPREPLPAPPASPLRIEDRREG